MYDGLPIIRIEIESMRAAILTALSERALALDEHVKNAIDTFCEPKNIQAIVSAKAETCLKIAVENAVAEFFQHGPGRVAIRSAVNQRLNEMLGGGSA